MRRAERVPAAETVRVGVAEGDLYPRLALFGTLGLESEDAGEHFDGDSLAFGFGPSLRWNVFDASRLLNRVEAQDARREQALVRWERSVLLALEEAEGAMTRFVREQVRRGHLLAATEQARRAAELAQFQYTDGLSDFQAVLVSERALADLEDQLAEVDAALATNLVALYKSLGGGWEHSDPAQLVASAKPD